MGFLAVFGYFDWVVLAVLLVVNYYKWHKFPPFKGCSLLAALLILFGFSLPIISMFLELKLYSNHLGETSNFFYTYFKFPAYWVIGIIQIAIIYFRGKKAS